MYCPIYTYGNWALITYLFEGSAMGNTYAVFLNSESEDYVRKLNKLRKLSPYLADTINSYAQDNVIIFSKKF